MECESRTAGGMKGGKENEKMGKIAKTATKMISMLKDAFRIEGWAGGRWP